MRSRDRFAPFALPLRRPLNCEPTGMLDYLRDNWQPQLVIGLSVLAVLSVAGYYVVGRFHGGAEEDRPSPSDLLTKYREMHRRGDISDEEFREIKTVLGVQMQVEVNDAEKEG